MTLGLFWLLILPSREAGAVTGCHSPSRAAHDGLRGLGGCPGAVVAEGPVYPASKTVLGGLGQWINHPLMVPPWPGPEAALAAVPGILSPVQAG